MRLAVDFNQPSWRKMLRGMTVKDYRDWQAFRLIEPFGELRADYRAAKIEARLFNLAVKKEFQRKVEDFLLTFEERTSGKGSQPPQATKPVVGPRTQSLEEQAQILTILAYAMAGQTPPGVV